MKPIVVCQVLNAYQVGGAETVALDLARSLDPGAFRSLALAALEPGDGSESPMQARFRTAGVETHALHHARFRDPRALWDLVRFFRLEKPDVVHAHNRPADYWALRCALWAGVPAVIWTRHLVYEDMSARQLQRYRRLAARTPTVIAVSEAVRQYCLQREHLPADRVRTVVNGIDTRRFRPALPDARRGTRNALGLEDGEFCLLFVGRLTDQKAPEAFVALIHALRSRGLPVRGFLCGRGPLEERLRSLCADGNGAALLGVRQDVPDLLAACDLFVSTSRNEGLPLNVMEAMAAGAAFAAPDIDQVRELVAGEPDLEASLLPRPPRTGDVPDDLVARWAAIVARLLADADARGRCGAAGRACIERRFSLARMVEQHEAIYREILGR